jgi:tRNA threonylcarbamoyladenosine modification (KEOPS) complex  Pcc1 subunit
MKLTLETQEPYEHMHVLFAAELERKHERSSIILENANDKALFRVEAQDIAALRAAVNTITSIISVHEKTRQAIHGQP